MKREKERESPGPREAALFLSPPSRALPSTCNSITWHICRFVSSRGVSGRGLFCWPMMLFRFVIGRKVARRVLRAHASLYQYGCERVVHGGIWPSIILRDVCHHQSSHCSLELRVLPCIGKSQKRRISFFASLDTFVK